MVSGSLALLYFLLGFHGGRQGSGPDRGQSPVEWGDFPFGWPTGWASDLAGWASGLAGWPRGGNGRMDERTNGRTENLLILQDFVPYRGRCPASPMKTKEKVEQGKGTADHLMPLGYLFVNVLIMVFFSPFWHFFSLSFTFWAAAPIGDEVL